MKIKIQNQKIWKIQKWMRFKLKKKKLKEKQNIIKKKEMEWFQKMISILKERKKKLIEEDLDIKDVVNIL